MAGVMKGQRSRAYTLCGIRQGGPWLSTGTLDSDTDSSATLADSVLDRGRGRGQDRGQDQRRCQIVLDRGQRRRQGSGDVMTLCGQRRLIGGDIDRSRSYSINSDTDLSYTGKRRSRLSDVYFGSTDTDLDVTWSSHTDVSSICGYNSRRGTTQLHRSHSDVGTLRNFRTRNRTRIKYREIGDCDLSDSGFSGTFKKWSGFDSVDSRTSRRSRHIAAKGTMSVGGDVCTETVNAAISKTLRERMRMHSEDRTTIHSEDRNTSGKRDRKNTSFTSSCSETLRKEIDVDTLESSFSETLRKEIDVDTLESSFSSTLTRRTDVSAKDAGRRMRNDAGLKDAGISEMLRQQIDEGLSEAVSAATDLQLPCLGCIQAGARHFDEWGQGDPMQSVESLPVLEMMEHQVDERGDRRKMYQAYKGQLKVSAFINYGLLTVHVMQGRHFTSKYRNACDSYVKISMVPDDSRRTKCKTEVHRDTNHPLFDEKFSFELLESDLDRRLLISVWNKYKGRSEFLGCMSFGIHHLQRSSKVVDNWYYILSEDIGRRKHLQVGGKNRKLHKDKVCPVDVPNSNHDLLWMDTHTFLIKKGSRGYGFSVTGGSPAQVCRVEHGSPGYRAGLQKYDCIIRLNGQNVVRSSCENVARLVRHSAKKIILEVQRPRPLLAKAGVSPNMSLANTTLHSNMSTDTSSTDDSPPLRLEDLRETICHHDDPLHLHERSLEEIVRDLERDTWDDDDDEVVYTEYDIDNFQELDGLLASHVIEKPRRVKRHNSLASLNVKEEWEKFRRRHKELQRERSISKPDVRLENTFEQSVDDIDTTLNVRGNTEERIGAYDCSTLPRNFFSSTALKKVKKPSQELLEPLSRISEVDGDDSFFGSDDIDGGKSRGTQHHSDASISGKSRSTLSPNHSDSSSRVSSDRLSQEQLKSELEHSVPRRQNPSFERSWLGQTDEANNVSVDSIFDASDSDDYVAMNGYLPELDNKLTVSDTPSAGTHGAHWECSNPGSQTTPVHIDMAYHKGSPTYYSANNIHAPAPLPANSANHHASDAPATVIYTDTTAYNPTPNPVISSSNTDAGQHRPNITPHVISSNTQKPITIQTKLSRSHSINKYDIAGKENFPYAINKTAALPSSSSLRDFKPHIEHMNPQDPVTAEYVSRIQAQLDKKQLRPFQDLTANVFV